MFKLSLLILCIATFCQANVDLLSTLESGQNTYELREECKSSIETHKSQLASADLKKKTQSLESLRFFSNYFFHFSPTDLSQTIEKSGFKEILKHQMISSTALDNKAGVGFYVAANPFSSVKYGQHQIIMKLDPNSRVLNLTNSENAKVWENFYSFISKKVLCPQPILYSLILEANDLDAVYYDKDYQWLAIYNEEIISKKIIIDYKGEMSNGQLIEVAKKYDFLDVLIPYTSEINPHSSNKILNIAWFDSYFNTHGVDTFNKMASLVKDWTRALKLGFLIAAASMNKEESARALEYLWESKLLKLEELFWLDIKTCSEGFKQKLREIIQDQKEDLLKINSQKHVVQALIDLKLVDAKNFMDYFSDPKDYSGVWTILVTLPSNLHAEGFLYLEKSYPRVFETFSQKQIIESLMYLINLENAPSSELLSKVTALLSEGPLLIRLINGVNKKVSVLEATHFKKDFSTWDLKTQKEFLTEIFKTKLFWAYFEKMTFHEGESEEFFTRFITPTYLPWLGLKNSSFMKHLVNENQFYTLSVQALEVKMISLRDLVKFAQTPSQMKGLMMAVDKLLVDLKFQDEFISYVEENSSLTQALRIYFCAKNGESTPLELRISNDRSIGPQKWKLRRAKRSLCH